MIKNSTQIQTKLVPLIKKILTDVKKSDESVYTYFNPSAGNKKRFKESAELRPYMTGGGSVSIFANEKEAEAECGEVVDIIFGKMMSEFKQRRVGLYLPDKDGKFRTSQEQILYHFGEFILEKMDVNAAHPESKTQEGQAEIRKKIIEETTAKLAKSGNLEVTDGLKFNEATGLIEGKVKNSSDFSEQPLNVKIDPANPELLTFSDQTGGTAFILENTDKELGLFKGKSNWEVMSLSGFTDTKDGIPVRDNEKEPLEKTPAEANATEPKAPFSPISNNENVFPNEPTSDALNLDELNANSDKDASKSSNNIPDFMPHSQKIQEPSMANSGSGFPNLQQNRQTRPITRKVTIKQDEGFENAIVRGDLNVKQPVGQQGKKPPERVAEKNLKNQEQQKTEEKMNKESGKKSFTSQGQDNKKSKTGLIAGLALGGGTGILGLIVTNII